MTLKLKKSLKKEVVYDENLRESLKLIESISRNVKDLLVDYFGNEAAAVNFGHYDRLEAVLKVKQKVLSLLPTEVVELLSPYNLEGGTNQNRENILKIFNI